MLSLLSFFLILVIVVIALTLPKASSVGYLIVIMWIMFLIHLIFYRNDEVSKTISKKWR